MYTYEKHGIHKSRGNYQDCKWLILWARGIWKTRFFNELFFYFYFFFFYIRLVSRTSFFFLNSSYKNYHVKKIWESHSKGQHLCIFRRFVNEPGHPKKNRTREGGSEGDAANTLAVGRCTRGSAVQTSGIDTHIPPKLPAEKIWTARLVCCRWTDWQTRSRLFFFFFFLSKSCRSSAPWVRGPSSRLQSQWMVSELSGSRAETLVVSAVQHTNMLVRLFKTELPQ